MLTLALLTCLPAQNAPPTTPREKALELLAASLDSAPGAQPEVAALALLRIGENYDLFDHKKSLEALNRAFAASLGIPPEKTGRREKAQSLIAGATVPVSLPDAVAMLKRITAGAASDEDPRQEAIEAATAKMIEKKQVDAAIDLINSVGATGKYPFKAARQIFAALPPEDVRRPAIFAYALSAYTLRPSEEFGEFLVKHWKEIPKTTAEAAVGQMVSTVLSAKDEGWNETLSAEKGSLTLHGRRNVELFDLMHVLEAIDPKRAAEILDRNPELKAAIARFPQGRESMGQIMNWSHSDGDPGPADERGAEMGRVFGELEKLPEDMSDRLKMAKLLDLAKSVRNPSIRLEVLTSIIGGLEDDPVAAGSILSQCIELLKEVKALPQRAESWSTVALAAHQIKDDNLAREALDYAFDDAAELYKLDIDADEPNPGPRDQWPSANAYRRIMISGAKIFGVDSPTLLNRIIDPDMALFARVELAQALLERPHGMWLTFTGKTKK
jgi:hypothetical protein